MDSNPAAGDPGGGERGERAITGRNADRSAVSPIPVPGVRSTKRGSSPPCVPLLNGRLTTRRIAVEWTIIAVNFPTPRWVCSEYGSYRLHRFGHANVDFAATKNGNLRSPFRAACRRDRHHHRGASLVQ